MNPPDAHHPATPPGGETPRCPGPSCKEICEFLCDFVDRELPPARQLSFEAHLKACPPCAEYMRQYTSTIRLAKQCLCPGHTKPPPVPEDMVRAIVQALGLPGHQGPGGTSCAMSRPPKGADGGPACR